MEAAMAPPLDRAYESYMREMNIQQNMPIVMNNQNRGQREHTGDVKSPTTPIKLENKLGRTPLQPMEQQR
jgi:hypothetical protein